MSITVNAKSLTVALKCTHDSLEESYFLETLKTTALSKCQNHKSSEYNLPCQAD